MLKEITEERYRNGYDVLIEGYLTHKDYHMISKTAYDTYIVREPFPEEQNAATSTATPPDATPQKDTEIRQEDAKFRAQVMHIAKELALLVADKNEAYGNSFGDSPYILRKLYPNGVQPDQYEDMLAIVRVLDKLKRIATNKNAFGENPWKDVAGYGLVQLTLEELRVDTSSLKEETNTTVESEDNFVVRPYQSSQSPLTK